MRLSIGFMPMGGNDLCFASRPMLFVGVEGVYSMFYRVSSVFCGLLGLGLCFL